MSNSSAIPRIKTLSSSLANQIAAGEVIERPASVVKELLENSLDAGAKHIVVKVEKAGTQLISVSDDGHGIHPEDLQLALQRHATAKLNSQADLTAIRSLGFRGEALPSISSVAAISLTSRIAEKEHASKLSFAPDSGLADFMPAAHAVGTTVEVRNLFHNTPARKKFLRSERTEFLHVQEMTRRLALSRFNITFSLIHNNHKVINCRAVAENKASRVGSLLGQSFINSAIEFNHSAGGMHFWGWLGTGELGRSSTDRQYLYLNGRMIRDKRLNHAIRLACEGLLEPGRFPTYVLYLEMDAGAADVNVHPSKHEVRFHQARDVHDFVYSALSRSLQLSQNPDNRIKAETYVTIGDGNSSQSQMNNIVSDPRPAYVGKVPGRGTSLPADSLALGRMRLQIEEGFVITQRGKEFLLINVKAAQKHIAFQRFSSAQQESISLRPLLVPLSYEISTRQENSLLQISSLLEEFALQFELSGPGLCRVRAIPNLLTAADIASLLEDILDLQISKKSEHEIKDALIAVMLSHVSDIPNPNMHEEDVSSLLRQLENSGLDTSLKRCPPIWSTLDTDMLDRLVNAD